VEITVRETGFIQPIKRVDVKSKVAGLLAHLAVDEGDRVEKGQVIARLDVPELEAQRDQVKAQLDAARARVEQARLSSALDRQRVESQAEQAEAGVRAAEAALKEAETRMLDAERIHENKRRLFEMGGFVSRNEVDSAKAAVEVAAQQHRAAQERVREQEAALALAKASRVEAQLGESRVAEAQASLRQVQDSLAEVESRLRDAVIRAPSSGVVITRHIREGELITAVSYYGAGAPIVTIGDLSTMLAEVDLNEVDVDKVDLGHSARITVDALRGRSYRGRVTRISPASRTGGSGSDIVRFPVEITVMGATGGLMPGMTANVEITCQRAENVLWVPNDTLFQKKGKWYVTVFKGHREGKPLTEDREVTKGLANDSRTEIRSGLKKGEKVEPGKTDIPERKKIDIQSGHGERG
jgi:HlyD family secretion protein